MVKEKLKQRNIQNYGAGILRPTQRTPSPNNYHGHQVQLITFDTKFNLLRLTLRPTKLSALSKGK